MKKAILGAVTAATCLAMGSAAGAETPGLTVTATPEQGPAGTTFDVTADIPGNPDCITDKSTLGVQLLDAIVTPIAGDDLTTVPLPEREAVTAIMFVGFGFQMGSYTELRDLAFSQLHRVELVGADGATVANGTIEVATGEGGVTAPEGTAPGEYEATVTCLGFVDHDSAAVDAVIDYILEEFEAAGSPSLEDPLNNPEAMAFIESIGPTAYLGLIEPAVSGSAPVCVLNSLGECAAEPAPETPETPEAPDAPDTATPTTTPGAVPRAAPARAVTGTPNYTG